MEIDQQHRKDVARGEHVKRAYRELSDSRYGNRLSFQFANGNRKSLPYTHMIETEYNGDVGVILTYVGHRVTIMGRNLFELNLRLEEENVGEIHERHDYHGLQVDENEPYVDRISWEVI